MESNFDKLVWVSIIIVGLLSSNLIGLIAINSHVNKLVNVPQKIEVVEQRINKLVYNQDGLYIVYYNPITNKYTIKCDLFIYPNIVLKEDLGFIIYSSSLTLMYMDKEECEELRTNMYISLYRITKEKADKET